ncbi:hypothetical protein WMY93_024871 [Mugilogobius chulae]|uniref:long-chain-fatty-acid--CoA ligase n=1 Tax=Mugilogobius chulae TaxID=88201 RepID=A0AAW0NDC5_9GOBI
MEAPGEAAFVESSCGRSDSAAELDQSNGQDTANESSEEESTGEREEENRANDEVTAQSTQTAGDDKKPCEGRERSAPSLSSVSSSSEPSLWTSRGDAEVKLRMGESGMAAEPPLTVNQMFTSTVERFGDFTALGWKDGEQQKSLTYKEYYQACRSAAKSFLKLGLERYHGVGILGFNSVEWFIADIGAILAGGFAVGIYTTNSPDACQYVADNCKANVIVVENHKQLQKILQVEDRLPHLKAIIQYKDALKEKRPKPILLG